jgi:hypothetical protein
MAPSKLDLDHATMIVENAIRANNGLSLSAGDSYSQSSKIDLDHATMIVENAMRANNGRSRSADPDTTGTGTGASTTYSQSQSSILRRRKQDSNEEHTTDSINDSMSELSEYLDEVEQERVISGIQEDVREHEVRVGWPRNIMD